MKVTDFEIMLADGCFGAQLLIDLCGPGPGYRPEMIRALVARFPQCVNVQKWRSGSTSDAVAEDGDTVLHYCAKIGSGCQGAVEQWLPKDTEVVYTPIRNNRQSHVVGGQTFPHWTALHEAISRSNKTMALHLLGALTTTMNDFTSEIITDTITLMTMKMPHLVPQMLVLIEKRLLLTEGARYGTSSAPNSPRMHCGCSLMHDLGRWPQEYWKRRSTIRTQRLLPAGTHYMP